MFQRWSRGYVHLGARVRCTVTLVNFDPLLHHILHHLNGANPCRMVQNQVEWCKNMIDWGKRLAEWCKHVPEWCKNRLEWCDSGHVLQYFKFGPPPPTTQHITATGRGQRIVVHRVEHTRLICSALLAFFLIMVVHGMNAKPRLFEFSELSMIALDLPRESAAVLWIY